MSEVMPPPPETAYHLFGTSLQEWHVHLAGQNNPVPLSRYGSNADECAWWAIAGLIIQDHSIGRPDNLAAEAHHQMSLVVNDSDAVIEMAMAHIDLLPKEVLDNLTVEGAAL